MHTSCLCVGEREKGKNQVCWCHANAHLDILSQVLLIPASLVSNMHGVQKMLLSATSIWQHVQVPHPSCSPQQSETPLAGRGA